MEVTPIELRIKATPNKESAPVTDVKNEPDSVRNSSEESVVNETSANEPTNTSQKAPSDNDEHESLSFESELKYDPATQNEIEADDSYEPDIDSNYALGETRPVSENTDVAEEQNDVPEVVTSPAAIQLGPNAEAEDDDDYDPEQTLNTSSVSNVKHNTPPDVPGLPPKPNLGSELVPGTPGLPQRNLQEHQRQLKEAYDAIMQSELVKDPSFETLPEAKQMELIMEQLEAKGITFNSGMAYSSATKMNYDQVHSYNKPFKNLKNPIPLIPVNEFCKRPNITAPMTQDEEEAYNEFIKQEAQYMEAQNWEDFPDKARLFIGNLPANTISKQDLFRIFRQYGEVIQIAIKAGYGFAQFRTAEACLDCIKGETNVPLHNKIMRLDASKPQKPRKSETGNRERTDEEHQHKKFRKGAPDCQIYITGKSSVFFIRKVKKAFENLQIDIETEDVTHKELNDVISEAAYSGVISTCVIKEQKVDVQTFEAAPDGGIKFEEYADVDPEVAADLVHKTKMKKYGAQASPPMGMQNNFNPESMANNYGGRFENNAYGSYGQMGSNNYDRRGGFDRRGRGGRSRQRWNNNKNGVHQTYGYNYDPQAYATHGSAPEQYTQPYVPPYGNPSPPIKYNNPPISYGEATPGKPQPIIDTSQSGLIQTLQSMDPASVRDVISLIQQKQNQAPSSATTSYQPLNYGSSPGLNQAQPANNQVNSLLNQLKSTQDSSNNTSGSSTQSLMETLARLSKK